MIPKSKRKSTSFCKKSATDEKYAPNEVREKHLSLLMVFEKYVASVIIRCVCIWTCVCVWLLLGVVNVGLCHAAIESQQRDMSHPRLKYWTPQSYLFLVKLRYVLKRTLQMCRCMQTYLLINRCAALHVAVALLRNAFAIFLCT